MTNINEVSPAEQDMVKAAVIYNDIVRVFNQAMFTISQLTKDEGILGIIRETMDTANSQMESASKYIIQAKDAYRKEAMNETHQS